MKDAPFNPGHDRQAIPAPDAGKLRRLACWLRGHKWVERKPHRTWDVNTTDCLRCGATKKVSFDGGPSK